MTADVFRQAVLALVLGATPAFSQADPFGGSGAHFFVAQEIETSIPGVAGRCAASLAPAPLVEAVRESRVVAPLPGVATAVLDFDGAAGGPVTGSISVCYLPSAGRTRGAIAILELVRGDDRLLIEAAGECSDYPTPKNPDTFFQSCSLAVTGPHAERVRGGSLASGGLVPRAAPAASVTPNVWTLFVVRD